VHRYNAAGLAGLRNLKSPGPGSKLTAAVQSLQRHYQIRPRSSRWRGLRDFIGNMPTFPGIYPDYSAPIVRNAPDGLRASFARAIRRWQRCLKFAGRMVWSILPSALYVACASRSVREFRRPALQQSGSALTHTGAFSKAEDLLREPATSGPAHRARRW
jgi:hypothetical protein